MSAEIFDFPIVKPRQPSAAAPADERAMVSAAALARKFTDHYLPIVQASIELLEADQSDFESRCRRMLDPDGTRLIDELCAEMELVGRQMKLLVDGLELTRARLRTGIARFSEAGSELR